MTRALDAPIGLELPPFRRHVTREMAITNAGPMRNFHTVVEEARAMGFDDLVVAGPMFTCFYSEMLTRFFGEAWMTAGRMEFKLYKPVIVGETVAARAVVRGRELLDTGTRVELEIWCEREGDGARTSGGTASVVL